MNSTAAKEKRMKRKKGSTTGRLSLGFFGVVFLAGVALLPTCADAQSQGNNAVYHYVSITNKGQCCKGSSAFIDASVFVSKATTFCGVLNYVLANINQPPTYPNGAVIDARGLNSGNTIMTCTASPWGSGSGYLNVPSTILLPATGGATPTPIQIPSTWILPVDTRLIGEGDNISSGTTIQAIGPNFITATPMISFGLSSLCTASCSGISVENLTLDGQGQAIDGIHNDWSQDISYVNHVSLYQIQGTGLSVSGNASNSGPYSNITFDTSTVCASINGVSGTRGEASRWHSNRTAEFGVPRN
jgi:hypothetical protein